MRLRRVMRWGRIIVLVALPFLIYFGWPGSWTYTVSPETTYITDPLDDQGHPDYPTALNRRLAEGVTPENNACVLIWQALGPHPEKGKVPPDHFRWLQIDPPPESGTYFVSWEQFHDSKFKAARPLVERWGEPPDEAEQEWLDRLKRSMSTPWKPDEDPDLAEWLKINEEPLALAIEASKRPRYYSPLIANAKAARIMHGLLPTLRKTGELCKALAARAMQRASAGRTDLAWADLMACQRLGRLLTNGALLVERMVGYSATEMSAAGQLRLLSTGVAPAQVQSALKDLRSLPSIGQPADSFDLVERFTCLDALLTAARYGPEFIDSPGVMDPKRPPFYQRLFTPSVDYDPAFRRANEVYDRLAAASRLPGRSERRAGLDELRGDVAAMKAQAKAIGRNGPEIPSRTRRGENIGAILIPLTLPNWDKVLNVADHAEQFDRNRLVAFALAAHKADTGRYPARLEELAPKYLAAVPGDLYSGRPLIYRPTDSGYSLASVGPNADEDHPAGELFVSMPPKEPARK